VVQDENYYTIDVANPLDACLRFFFGTLKMVINQKPSVNQLFLLLSMHIITP